MDRRDGGGVLADLLATKYAPELAVETSYFLRGRRGDEWGAESQKYCWHVARV